VATHGVPVLLQEDAVLTRCGAVRLSDCRSTARRNRRRMRTGLAARPRAAPHCTAGRESAHSRHRRTAGSGQRARSSVDDSCCRIGSSPRMVASCAAFFVHFRFAPSLAHLSPEARTRHALSAILMTPSSPGSNDTEQFARPARSSPQFAAILCDPLAQTLPHAWHVVPFRSPRRAHAGGMKLSRRIVLRGTQ